MEYKKFIDRCALSYSASADHEALITMIERHMHIHYPGNYVIEDYYDPKLGKVSFRPKFEDKNEEVLWILKWSN